MSTETERLSLKDRLYQNRERLACLPLLLFLLSPALQLFYCFLHAGDTVFSADLFYSTLVNIVNVLAAVAAFVTYYFFAISPDRSSLPSLWKSVPARLPFLLLCVWMVIVTMINGFTEAALSGDSYRGESLFTFISYFAVYFMCGSFIRSEKKKQTLVFSFLIVNTILNLLVLVDHFITPVAIFKYNETFCAIFRQFNHYGYFLMLGIILSAALLVTQTEFRQQIFPAVAFLLNTFLLSVNNTFGCFLTCLVTLTLLIVAASLRRKRFDLKALAVWVVFIAFSFTIGARFSTYLNDCTGFVKDIGAVAGISSDTEQTEEEAEDLAAHAGTGRWTLWTHTVSYIKERPLFGWGIEGINERLNTETNGVNDRPHNEYLQYTAFFGIPGGLLYVAGLVLVAVRALKRFRSLDNTTFVCLAATFAYLFSALFGNTMFYTAPFLFIFMGLSCAWNEPADAPNKTA